MKNKLKNTKENIYAKSPCCLQNLLCTLMGYKLKKQRYGKHYNDYYKLLKSMEFGTEEEILKYQESELKKLILHCNQNVPYYKKLFRDLEIDMNNITLDILKKIPILTKDTIKANINDFIAQNYKKKDLIERFTSGTTGSGMKFYTDKKALQMEYATVWARTRPLSQKDNCYITFGGRVLVPINCCKPPFYRKNYADNQVLFSQYHLNDKNLKFYFEAFNSIKYHYIQGYPSSLFALAKYIEENKLILKRMPKAIYTSSETLLENQRELIEKVFNCQVYDYYGTTEFTSTFYQCENKNYHINHEYGITEYVPLNIPGYEDVYEIVSTGFLNYAFPLLRYKVDDFATLEDEDYRCGCKRPGRVVKSIDGRIDDIVVTPEGTKLALLAPIFKPLVNIRECQIFQEDYDRIIFKCIRGNNYTIEDEKLLILEFSTRIPESIKIEIEYVESIERSKSGKMRAIVSNIKNKRII